MHLHELLPALGDVTEVVHVDADPHATALPAALRIPAGVDCRRLDPADASKLDLADGGVVICLLGAQAGQVDPDELAPVLDALPVGGTAVLLLGWPILDLPYHRVLAPVVAASCQVLETIPLAGAAAQHGAYAAAIARRVERLATPRPYLIGRRPSPAPGPVDDLRAALRMAGEYVLSDLVSRAMRVRLADLERDLATRDARLREVERDLDRTRARVGRLTSSTSYRVGRAVARGARNPARAVFSVPLDLARIWRARSRPAP